LKFRGESNRQPVPRPVESLRQNTPNRLIYSRHKRTHTMARRHKENGRDSQHLHSQYIFSLKGLDRKSQRLRNHRMSLCLRAFV
jgi:hypothetical protein